MDHAGFVRTLGDDAPPAAANTALRALWLDANDRPEAAMRAAMANDGHACMRVRAYLHRKAGSADQARVCYWKAGVAPWIGSVQSEWDDIAATILAEQPVAQAYL